MNPHTDPLRQLLYSFDELQKTLESLRASRARLLDDYIQRGVSRADAERDYHSVLVRLQDSADQTSQLIRSLISESR